MQKLLLPGVLLGAVLVMVWAYWVGREPGLEAAARDRSLQHYRIDRYPELLPQAWKEELLARLEQAPDLSLLDPKALEVARELLASVSWIQPESIQVSLQLPEGLKLRYRPRSPLIQISVQGHRGPVLAADGTVLPPGLPAALADTILLVPLDPGDQLPEAGRQVASPLLQEALEVAVEAYALRRKSGLPIRRLERQPGYPANSPGVPPPFCLVLEDGTEIWWGRSEAAQDPFAPSLEQKIARLVTTLRRYPDLLGLRRVVLDQPILKLFDSRNQPIAVPEAGF
ncbi:MAG: hypothetical protein DWQ01_18960 [Planctomycetota bacterium]|nr:MAG: hypothetical protein DWQ01_18960 [Planctomycetota bacterium]